MSIIRYRYKADKNFESVKIDGMSCSLGELKRLIAAKSSRPGTHQPKHDYDLIISNANTHEEYKDHSDLIPRNASVIVARRIRGSSEALTPFSNQKPVVSSDDIVNEILLPAILNQKHEATISMPSAIIETKAVPLDKVTESSSNVSTKEMTENELIKEIQMGSQARYVTPQPSYRTNLFVCHNCKQPGHIKSQCPLLLQSSNTTGNTSVSSSGGDQTLKTDGSQSINSGQTRSVAHSSNIYTRHAPYQHPYYHSRGGRSHHRGSGHPRGEPLPKKTTGIPRDRLITVPKHIAGALKDPTGASVVPTQVAELYVERMEKKTNLSIQLSKQSKGQSLILSAGKSSDDDPPPDDLLCPLCKKVCADAVITPCCNFSFCDGCIRSALIDSSDHKCPHCQRQHVAIDQINPNLFLRNHVNRWHERQNQVSYSQNSTSQSTLQKIDQESDMTSKFAHDSIDEYDVAILSTSSEIQPSIVPIKSAPIVIKMQPLGKSQSPQPVVSTRPADMTFEDEKTIDSDQISSSQKQSQMINNNIPEETIHTRTDILTSSIPPEHEKSESETSSYQPTSVNPMYSSSTTTLSGTNSMVPHYYPTTASHLLPTPVQQNLLYSHHIAQTPSNGLYPIQQNYYPPPMGIRYPPGGIHAYQPYAPGPPVHHHPLPPPPIHHPHPHPHPIIASPHVSNNPINGYNVAPFLPHTNAPFASTSTSTFITHHQTATQPISTALTTALSEDEFYIKQRYFQRIQRSPSRRRTRSRSSSYSSYSSSDSRSSSRSRHDHRDRRRLSRSRSRHRVDIRRTKSPNRHDRRQRRSSSYRTRRGPPVNRENYSSKYRRSPLRRSRDHDRRRSPRPPPTVQQSTQRTIVYMHESSQIGRDRHRRTKSRSRGIDDRRVSSSSKTEQKSQSDSIVSSMTVGPPKLSSTIETVAPETSDIVEKDDKSTELSLKNPSTEEMNSRNAKKHKKHHHHHKKHRRQGSKSKKHHRSKDKEKKTIVDTSSSTTIIQIQS